MLSELNILLRHNYISIPDNDDTCSSEDLATIMMNLSYYGYALDVAAFEALNNLSRFQMVSWWKFVEIELKSIIGDDRDIGDFVVYKNFPQEVLKKSEAEYWIAQILMYWGLPNEFFTESIKPRKSMKEQPELKILKKSNHNTTNKILNEYISSPTRWKPHEELDVFHLSKYHTIDFSKFYFKENLISLATKLINDGETITATSATDVLRLGAGLSGADISLREKIKFLSFKRKTRRFLLSMLEKCNNLSEDVSRRPALWKSFLYSLHPWDYKERFPKTAELSDKLYNDKLVSFNAQIEKYLAACDDQVLDVLSSRPGEFRRRLVHTIDLFGKQAVKSFTSQKVLNKLTTYQLISLRKMLQMSNIRQTRVFPPKGNWNKLKIGKPKRVNADCVFDVSEVINQVLKDRLPKIKILDINTNMIKLSSNDGEVSSYTRGTEFLIPKNITFIRTASYWEIKNKRNIWFDNGWNFFNDEWKSIGACCWNHTHDIAGAIFSGDPTNSKEMHGRATQLIDLNLLELQKQNVRYAVWNILCYSRIPFSKATDVFAALQWGERPQSGKLFEPSRCQLSFPLTGEQLTKYICYIDLKLNKMIYMDANLNGVVISANNNSIILQRLMPAFVDYLNSLPSIYDLFENSVDENANDGYVLYSDKELELKDVLAYVFKSENENNSYNQIDINKLLVGN